MPVHVFEHESSGERVEDFFFSMREVPDQIEKDGRIYRRIIGGGNIQHRYAVWSERPDQDDNRRSALAAMDRPNVNCPGGISISEAFKSGYAEPPEGAKWAPRTGRTF